MSSAQISYIEQSDLLNALYVPRGKLAEVEKVEMDLIFSDESWRRQITAQDIISNDTPLMNTISIDKSSAVHSIFADEDSLLEWRSAEFIHTFHEAAGVSKRMNNNAIV